MQTPTVPGIDGLKGFGTSFTNPFRIFFLLSRRLVLPVYRLINEFGAYKAHYLAAAIALFTFLSIFPLTIGLITLIHLTFGEGWIDEAIHNALERQIPLLSDAASGSSFVEDFLTHAASNTGLTSSIAGLVLFVSTLGVFSAIRESVNVVWGIEHRRTFFMQRVVDAALMLIASGLLFSSILVSGFFSFLEELSQFVAFDTDPIRQPIVHVGGIVLPWGITWVVFAVIYWWLPNTKLSIKDVLPISLVATVFFEIVKFVFISYLHYLSGRLFSVYGSLAALMMFFVFIYMEAIVMLAGAMLCSKWVRYRRSSVQSRLFESPWSNRRRLAVLARVALRPER